MTYDIWRLHTDGTERMILCGYETKARAKAALRRWFSLNSLPDHMEVRERETGTVIASKSHPRWKLTEVSQ